MLPSSLLQRRAQLLLLIKEASFLSGQKLIGTSMIGQIQKMDGSRCQGQNGSSTTQPPTSKFRERLERGSRRMEESGIWDTCHKLMSPGQGRGCAMNSQQCGCLHKTCRAHTHASLQVSHLYRK